MIILAKMTECKDDILRLKRIWWANIPVEVLWI